jgi:hypothetical protein
MHKNTRPLLNPAADILASKKWERAVLITTKKPEKAKNLSSTAIRAVGIHACGNATAPADLLSSGGFHWQSSWYPLGNLPSGQSVLWPANDPIFRMTFARLGHDRRGDDRGHG